jgi:hypothetical protein
VESRIAIFAQESELERGGRANKHQRDSVYTVSAVFVGISKSQRATARAAGLTADGPVITITITIENERDENVELKIDERGVAIGFPNRCLVCTETNV